MPHSQLNLLWWVESTVRTCTRGRLVTLTYMRYELAKQKLHRLKLCRWKTAVALQPQPSAKLSVKMRWDMPTKIVSENTAPSRRSTVYPVHQSRAETWNMKILWFNAIINKMCSRLANKPAQHNWVIILLKSDYLSVGNSCMLLAFGSQPNNWKCTLTSSRKIRSLD